MQIEQDTPKPPAFNRPDDASALMHLKLPIEVDPYGIAANTPGAKLDAGKMLPWLCISGFSRALTCVAQVTTQGARKYTPNGWVSVADGEARYMEAFGRHMLALGRGEVLDGDTGCMHHAQMIWNALAALELQLQREEIT